MAFEVPTAEELKRIARANHIELNDGELAALQGMMPGQMAIFETADDAWLRIRRTVEMVAGSAGATATIDIVKELPITYNDQDLAAASLPTLVRIVGRANVLSPDPVLAAEDFAFYQEKIPGLFVYLGVKDPKADPATVEDVHSPRFYVYEPALKVGVRTMSSLAVDYLLAHQ